ncbi:hypothetical protein SLS60_004716 [Paraconiothyrium brasiliense]|uniref:Uncharacterized protein n=1 Tax=Paraconiothyrium brasiliense TaxID=300254 RepID=A0ABR3RMN3_9PLEO
MDNSHFHKLQCGHTVITNPGASCGRNCSTADSDDSFICHMCILMFYDPSLTEDNCSSNVRYMLGDLGRCQTADAEEDVEEHLAKGLRPSDPAKAQDWLGDFFNEYPDAYTEEKVKETETRKTETRETETRQTGTRKTGTRKTETRKTETRKTETRKTETRKTQTKKKNKNKKRKRNLEDGRGIMFENAARNNKKARIMN